ncbi:ligase-associated DNA damage response endonuclease PdeM [Henriciella sp.]|uniref:ligase-associated DNA damage response endonuclease PdeM n=1 Tax=Henriciella sp. TaxID=1968823 RepID=UPI00263936DF|nr:ligase-associated DNA damage response endonuclease PdeM [Henriciella sp.]
MAELVPVRSEDTFLSVCGELFLPTGQGALWWERRKTLVVSDLHLEKGSSYAGRGQMLPPHDTGATLDAVEKLVGRFCPETVISLGDSFHDPLAEARLSMESRDRIRRLTSSTQWYWVEGNHDPDPPAHLGGMAAGVLKLGPCIFRHEPTGATGEIAGHLHPVARLGGRGRSLRRKCFVTDGRALILPSMGAFTGGLNVLDPAITGIFSDGAMVFAVNGTSVRLIENALLLPDRRYQRSGIGGWRM